MHHQAPAERSHVGAELSLPPVTSLLNAAIGLLLYKLREPLVKERIRSITPNPAMKSWNKVNLLW
jgi:hypothetical protein